MENGNVTKLLEQATVMAEKFMASRALIQHIADVGGEPIAVHEKFGENGDANVAVQVADLDTLLGFAAQTKFWLTDGDSDWVHGRGTSAYGIEIVWCRPLKLLNERERSIVGRYVPEVRG